MIMIMMMIMMMIMIMTLTDQTVMVIVMNIVSQIWRRSSDSKLEQPVPTETPSWSPSL